MKQRRRVPPDPDQATTRSPARTAGSLGRLPDLAIDIQTYATAALLLILWFRFARGPADARTLTLAAAGAVAIYVGLGRVLSDQYVIWLIPLVAMVPWGAARLAGPGGVAVLVKRVADVYDERLSADVWIRLSSLRPSLSSERTRSAGWEAS